MIVTVPSVTFLLSLKLTEGRVFVNFFGYSDLTFRFGKVVKNPVPLSTRRSG